MAANVQIHEIVSASAGVDKTSSTIRFKAADTTSVDTSNGVVIPSSGTTYSFTKQLRFNFNTAPVTNIQNLRAYSAGGAGFGTGVGVNYDTTNVFGSNFSVSLGGTSFFTKTSGSPIVLDTTNVGPFTGTGYKGDILRLQMNLISTATAGLLAAQTATFTYDES
jgi:hypothetical protein